MKRISLLFLLFIFPAILFAQQNTLDFNKQRYDHFRKMKNNGLALIITGAALNVVGIPMYIKGINEMNKSSTDSELDAGFGKSMGGLAIMVVGELALAGGITLHVIGNKKSKQYKQLIETEQKELSFNMTQNGLTLQLRF